MQEHPRLRREYVFKEYQGRGLLSSTRSRALSFGSILPNTCNTNSDKSFVPRKITPTRSALVVSLIGVCRYVNFYVPS